MTRAAPTLVLGHLALGLACGPRGLDLNAGNGARAPMEHPGHVTLHVVAELTEGPGRRLAFAPDGDRWASAAAGTVHLWRGTQHTGLVAAPTGATDRVTYGRDGASLLVSPYVYDLTRGAWVDLASLAGQLGPPGSDPHAAGVTAAAWAPDGEDVVISASLGERGSGGAPPGPRERVVVLRGARRELVATLYEGDDEQRVVAVDDRFVAFGGRDVVVWSRAERRQVAVLRAHAVPVHDLAFSPDGHLLASLDGRGALILWDTARWAQAARIPTSPASGLAVAFHPQLPLVATGGHDGVVRLWSTAAGAAAEPVFASGPLGGWVQALAFDPRGGLGWRMIAAVNSLPARVVMFAAVP